MKVSSVFMGSVSFLVIFFGALFRSLGASETTFDVAVALAVVFALLSIVAELREIARILAEKKPD